MSETESAPTPPAPQAPAAQPATGDAVATQPSIAQAAPADTAAELIDIEQFFKVKFRVGQVVAAERVEKSKKLLKLQVDLGPELGQRQILSGISQFYTPEQMLGKKIVVVANLKPAKMMGLESHGMLLAASTPDHSALTIISPGEEIPLGSAVS